MAEGMNRLSAWLANELKNRAWSGRELARRAGVSHTTVSDVLAGQREPTFEFCAAIAGPLNKTQIEVLRIAGILSHSGKIKEDGMEYNSDLAWTELIDLLRQMNPEERMDVLRYARFRHSERGASEENLLANGI